MAVLNVSWRLLTVRTKQIILICMTHQDSARIAGRRTGFDSLNDIQEWT